MSESEAPPEEAAVEDKADTALNAVVERLARELGDALVQSEVAGGDAWVRVRVDAWDKAAEICRDHLDMDYFCFLSGIDWLPNPSLSGRAVWDPAGDEAAPEEGDGSTQTVADGDTQIETGVAGGDTRFQLLARLYSTTTHLGITLKADLDDTNPRAPTWTKLYRGADWHERETWEMYGFDFEGHPGLRHLYLPQEFEGFPLRKDFPLLAREVKPWPGFVDKEPIPGEEDEPEESAEETE